MPLSLLALGSVLEGKYDYQLIDGNLDSHPVRTALDALRTTDALLVGVSVMPGPQVAPAIQISSALRAAKPSIPIVWGGYFPTLYSDAAINASYVDYLARGQGEDTLLELLAALEDPRGDKSDLQRIAGLTWKRSGQIIHNADRPFRHPGDFPDYPYEKLARMDDYLRPSFMGTRTASHQVAIGCRYHCNFCGVASMFNGVTRSQSPERTLKTLTKLRDKYAATAIQFYDNNFFDSEQASLPIVDALASVKMPWWCYARADTLAKFSTEGWTKIRRSNLKMAFIGADAVSDDVLAKMRKGSKIEHTLEAARRMREFGVIPEFSFILGAPEDPEGEIEKTFTFIRKLKSTNPECEIVLYFYSPTPQRTRTMNTYGPDGPTLPATPEEWTDPQWVSWICHEDAPWLTPKVRDRVKNFSKILNCRYPTIQDYHTPAWRKAVLKSLAGWRYKRENYGRPWELDIARRIIPLRVPQRESL
jgi:radical SAM superfamily enzyme YgiQ (UPF0313 family)